MTTLPSTSTGLWPDPDEGPFRLRIYWGEVDGRIDCVGFELTSVRHPDIPEEPTHWSPPEFAPNPTAVTSQVLRSLNLPTIVEETKKSTAAFHEYWRRARPDIFDDIDRLEVELVAIDEMRDRRRRPRVRGPEFYAAVARTYVRAVANGDPPTVTVSEVHNGSRSAAAKWVSKARDMGFLGKTTKGKAGGVLPPKGDDDE